MGAVSLRNVEPMQYSTVYYHDYHGWRDDLTTAVEAFNTFMPQQDEMLEAVSFFTAENDVDYTVTVFDTYSGGQLADELASVSGTALCTGLHTLDLAASIPLYSGDAFHVYLQLSSGGHPFDRTSEVPVLLGAKSKTIVESRADPGQSYFLDGSSWIDLTSIDTTANFCIKALANPLTGIEGGQDPSLLLTVDPLYPNPFQYEVTIPFTLAESGEVNVSVFDISGRQIQTITTSEFAAGSHAVVWHGGHSDGSKAAAGIYFARIWTEYSTVTRKVILYR